MATVKLNGIDLYYEVHGDGFPLVLISGFSSDHCAWLNILGDYARYFKVVILDNRGAGQTSAPDHPYTIAQMADDAVALCRHLDIDSAYFIGSSMGGKIVQNIASRYQTLCKKVVIVNSYYHIDPRFIIYLQGHLALMQADANPTALAQIHFPWAFGNKFLSNPDNVETLIQLKLQNPYPISITGFKNQMAALEDTQTTPDLSNITCPCLILAGEEDILTPPARAKILAEMIPNAQYHCFNDVGHVPVIEDKEQFNKVVLPFLQ